MSSGPELDELQVTAVMKRSAPAWWWLRRNFTLPAVLAIGGLVAGAGSWLWSQHTALRDLQHQVAELADPTARFEAAEKRLNKLELDRAALAPQLTDFDRRIGVQEHEWQVVHDAASQWRVPRGSQTGRRASQPGR